LVALNTKEMELKGIANELFEKNRPAELKVLGTVVGLMNVLLPVQSAAFIEKGLAVTRAPSISVPLHSVYELP
jgi:hypothetical protein